MTIDERLERLAERHEALAQSVEMLLASQRENERDFNQRFAEVRAEIRQGFAETGESIRALEKLVSQDAENIRALARIAEIHERRLTHVEEKS